MSRVPRVCVVGGGGREHALARLLARSAEVVVTPGNPGMAAAVPGGYPITVVPAPAEEVEADLVVVGPEAPLVDGLADRLRARGRPVVGPGADGARLEGSKAFMKAVLAEAGVPSAAFGVCTELEEARAFLRQLPGPWVVKTDGLAGGKGVLVAGTLEEAEADVAAKLSGAAFGDAGRRVVIEEGLTGPECSLLVLCDGRRVVPLAPAQDAKRLGDGDLGPNTGGMGAYAPLPWAPPDLADRLVAEAVEPLVGALVARGIDYRGVLYAGLMLTPDGPRVLEYNVRFGDPEAQAVLPLLDVDPYELLLRVAEGRLDRAPVPRTTGQAAVCVVLAAPGYPAAPRTGGPISGLADDGQLADPVPGATVLHAGTARAGEGSGPGAAAAGRPVAGAAASDGGAAAGAASAAAGEPAFVTAGGRVLGVTGAGDTVAAAREVAYRAVSQISFPGMQHRTDIADIAAAAVASAEGVPPETPAQGPTRQPHGVGTPDLVAPAGSSPGTGGSRSDRAAHEVGAQ